MGRMGTSGSAVYGYIAEINPTSHVITEFPTPSGNGATGITAGPDGNVWFTENYATYPQNIDQIDPTTGVITEYPALLPAVNPCAITTGPDGNLWFTNRKGARHSQRRDSRLVATGGNATAADQHHRGQRLRSDGRCRGQLWQLDHFVQRHGYCGTGDLHQ